LQEKVIRFRKELVTDLIYNIENIAGKGQLEIGKTTSEVDLIDYSDNFRYNVEDIKLAIGQGDQNIDYGGWAILLCSNMKMTWTWLRTRLWSRVRRRRMRTRLWSKGRRRWRRSRRRMRTRLWSRRMSRRRPRTRLWSRRRRRRRRLRRVV
jgi:hypothetical protein